jgi:hypothetical protein
LKTTIATDGSAEERALPPAAIDLFTPNKHPKIRFVSPGGSPDIICCALFGWRVSQRASNSFYRCEARSSLQEAIGRFKNYLRKYFKLFAESFAARAPPPKTCRLKLFTPHWKLPAHESH